MTPGSRPDSPAATTPRRPYPALSAAQVPRAATLRDLGVDLARVSRAVSTLLLDSGHIPDADEGRKIVAALVRNGLDAGTVGQVLATLAGGDTPPATEVAALVAEAHFTFRCEQSPAGNCLFEEVVRHEHAAGPTFVIRLTRLDRTPPETVHVEIGLGEFESEWRFVSKCIRDLSFAPAFKEPYRGEKFRTLAALLVGETAAPALKPEHGTRHGRPEHTPETSDLLLACVREHAQAAGGTVTSRVTPLYQALTAVAQSQGALPLDWPRSVPQLCWALRRIGHAGFEQAGVEWRKHHEIGTSRWPLYTFRLRDRQKRAFQVKSSGTA